MAQTPKFLLTLGMSMFVTSAVYADDAPPRELQPKPLHTLAGHTFAVTCLDFSPDSKHLASSCLGKKAIVWDTATGKEEACWVHKGQVYAVRFHPKDGTVITACWDAKLRVWELGQDEPRTILTSPFGVPEGQPGVIKPGIGGFSRLAIDSTGTRMLTEITGYHGPVLWDLKTGKAKPLAQESIVFDVAFSPNGKLFVVAHGSGGTGERVVNVWSTEKEKVVVPIVVPAQEQLKRVCLSPDGTLIAIGGHLGSVWIWNTETFTEVVSPGKVIRSGAVNGLQFTPDGKYLLIGGGGSDDKPGEISIWEMKTNKVAARFIAHSVGCRSLAISADGKHLATGSMHSKLPPCEVRLWDLTAILREIEKK